MQRTILLVMDGCGAGEAPDSAEFGDGDHPATLKHVWETAGGFKAPTLEACGLLAACGIDRPASSTVGVNLGVRWGRIRELSKGGKDSVTGHWEMAGIVTDQPFPTYPQGFPLDLIQEFERQIGRKTLGNRPASGTQIIAELGAEHVATGSPIVYTSADSVFQIACHEEVVPLPELYDICRTARKLLVAPNAVQRVIARPFVGDAHTGFKRTEHRKDFPVPPPPNLCDRVGDVFGIGVVPELFAGRGFRQVRRTQNNAEHAEMLWESLRTDARFIWANFEDFDMLYGHRNDPVGFAKCLEAFDPVLEKLIGLLGGEDMLLITADHGNDPTSPSTDHSRELLPFVQVGAQVTPGPAPLKMGLSCIAEIVDARI
ncbi:MAG TPA: phosphopentomutase [Fimbriimonas sp.]|nr:phosphopentomutase [Fimbriimonas sp.]